MDTGPEGNETFESGRDMCTRPRVKQTAGGEAAESEGCSARCSAAT